LKSSLIYSSFGSVRFCKLKVLNKTDFEKQTFSKNCIHKLYPQTAGVRANSSSGLALSLASLESSCHWLDSLCGTALA
jgi:hypothetical protein